MTALLVFDNATCADPMIPPSMGAPAPHQMKGERGEKLTELCGRICYDSLGGEKTRSSQDYHGHILEVRHTSVMRHFNFTVVLTLDYSENMLELFRLLSNRPGVWIVQTSDVTARVSLNINSAWSFVVEPRDRYADLHADLVMAFNDALLEVAPAYHVVEAHMDADYSFLQSSVLDYPQDDDERWLSFYLAGSRGWSHEQVRHSWRCAVSQRSTRYCDESGSPWIMHPTLRDYFAIQQDEMLHARCTELQAMSAGLYDQIVNKLQPYLISTGSDKFTARKQARGAARGFLGNALFTEMIFSASVNEWREIVRQRNNPAADGEILELYRDEVVPILSSMGVLS